MKYRIPIYALDYEIEAKSYEGAVRTAIARYAKMETAQWKRHCSPDRLTRDPTIAEGTLPMLTAHRVSPSRGHIAYLMRATFAVRPLL
jgi:hypothetical protein